jgi:hypothetical protein
MGVDGAAAQLGSDAASGLRRPQPAGTENQRRGGHRAFCARVVGRGDRSRRSWPRAAPVESARSRLRRRLCALRRAAQAVMAGQRVDAGLRRQGAGQEPGPGRSLRSTAAAPCLGSAHVPGSRGAEPDPASLVPRHPGVGHADARGVVRCGTARRPAAQLGTDSAALVQGPSSASCSPFAPRTWRRRSSRLARCRT